MENKICYIKADPSKELQDEIIEILEINQNCFKGTNEPNLHSAENIVDLFKSISLTELMVGFAEWMNSTDVNDIYGKYKSINPKMDGSDKLAFNKMYNELVEIYLTEKGIIL